MSDQTPLPQPLPLGPPKAREEDTRVRRRSNRPPVSVSAFSPGATGGLSVTPADRVFVQTLMDSGVALQLHSDELMRCAQLARDVPTPARCLDLLGAYYAGRSREDGARRVAQDHWFMHDAEDAATAAFTVARLLRVWPELREAQLERIGGEEGMLVVRSGEHFCAIEDEAPDEGGITTVAVREIVRAINVLLDRRGVRSRLVGLRGDGQREAYVALSSMGDAMTLAREGYLAHGDPEEIMRWAAW